MSIQNKIAFIVSNQNALNSKAYAEQWLENARTGQWDYAMAAVQELAEFNNSSWLPWWSKAERDPINCRIEIVDALHFMLSVAIAQVGNEADAAAHIEHAYNSSDLANGVQVVDWTTVNSSAKRVIHQLTADTVHVPSAFLALFDLCASLGFSFDALVALYTGKSVLNKFRQDKGYKSGLYRKVWPNNADGGKPMEDNYFLAEFVTKADKDLTPGDIRAWLEQQYYLHFEAPQGKAETA